MRRFVMMTSLAILLGARPIGAAGDTSIDWAKVDHDRAASSPQEPLSSAAAVVSNQLEEKQIAYEIGVLERRASAFEWQAIASKIIFGMVLLLVVVGVVFSAMQFRAGLRMGIAEDQELDISVQGIKIKTQFLGVLTLAFSLAFFYLYLKTVYPISEVP